ncbi:hypothetical protein JX265_000513 [Neoarthrinium moseri]|uniref:Phospholipid metabolism enzyme regulator n=1 Tax=Neoarthrinium moseri TaxID=1658444 RepID=A0A9Q0AWC3_9PEZI|nr:hypothetical protein JX265_000513 [Neoarthrinium moseri]
MERAEAETLPRHGSAGLEASISSLNSVDQETSATSSANVDTQPSRWTSTATSLTASPLVSRENSPTRSYPKSGRTSRSSTTRSRKNSFQEPSPSRTRVHPQVSTPRQQLSAATTPTLPPPPTSEPVLRAPQPQKPTLATEASKDAPRWPVSPRLKSPPPALNRPSAPPPRKNDQEPPMINVLRATPSPHPPPSESPLLVPSDTEGDETLSTGMRTPGRGPSAGSSTSQLETVQEVSQPNTPGPNLDLASEKLAQSGAAGGQPSKSDGAVNKILKSENNSESGSDSGSIKTRTRRSSAAGPPPTLQNRQSSSALRYGGKGHTSGDASKHITVEEEEVNSVPRAALGLNPAAQGGAGNSLKTKPSSETIRPRKEKKKTARKAVPATSGTGENSTLLAARPTSRLRHSRSIRSISSSTSCRSPRKLQSGQGSYVEEFMIPRAPSKLSRTPSITAHVTNLLTGGPRVASSKADIFEAKVASAVEENNSSDSDETFVYDSNPPDANDRPRRYHSRTPSATSMVSQVDRNGLRSIHSVLDSGPVNPAIKKNMKFVNPYNSNGAESLAGDDDGKGSGGRSNAGSGRGTARHHHHAGRWGRNNSNNHLSLFDNESPFPAAARSKLPGNTSRQSSNPPSPRFPPARGGLHNSKRQMAMAGYDMDDTTTTTGADDERTPLLHMNGNRSTRSNRSRRNMLRGGRIDVESHDYRSRPSFLNRFASCLVLTIMLLLVIMGAVGFMFATSQPLTDIKLVKIGSVLASEQELMMDITVKAHNPNIVVVSIDSADLEVFAKSPHAGTDSEWWRHPHDGELDILDDPPDDQPDDSPDDGKSPNMRLGNILELDSPLSFEGSFFQTGNSMSSGELRLVRPGNQTDGGTERWERILNDEFTLILKGVLKYTLPLSQKIRSVTISGKTTVKPNSANDPVLKPNGTNFEIGIS